MKVALIVMSFAPGGAEMLVLRMAAAFKQRGHACHVIAICSAEAIGNPSTFEEHYKQSLTEAGVSFEVLARRRHQNPIRGALALWRSVRRFRPDVLHIHAVQGLMFRSFAPLGLPTAYTHHNILLKFPAMLFRLFDRVTARYVAICEPCRQLLMKHVRRPVVQIYNGVPMAPQATTERKELPHDPILLSVGNLTGQKDYSTLITAAGIVAARLADQGRRPSFLIAGEGPERSALQTKIDTEGVGAFVKLLGARTDVAQLMQDATLMVNSSVYEGLPIALLEALQSSLPIVATDVGGNPDVVQHDRNGYLVPPGDPSALADHIVEALSNGERYAAFASAARESAGRFGLRECVDAHLALYEDLLAERPEAVAR